MLSATLFLLAIGLLGAFDIAYFHTWRGRLTRRAETRTEARIHVARGLVYAIQFLLIPNVRLQGAWCWALVGLFVVDAAIAVSDVLVEPASRKAQGGLEPSEYLIHVVLSVLVGGLLHSVFSSAWGDWRQPTRVVLVSEVPPLLRSFMAGMAAGSIAVALLEALSLWESTWRAPKPIHVKVRLETSLRALWDFTQDHHRHPEWDHRFSRIELLDETIGTGTTMKYEKDLGPFVIRGFGRYALHRPMQQSTFEFWSEDWRSLISRGAGLWRYTELAGGRVEFATSYTYAVRWGLFGRVFDRLVFRPAFQWYTQQSFERLARDHFPKGASPVLGADGRTPARFVEG
jgi:hypothetical protein